MGLFKRLKKSIKKRLGKVSLPAVMVSSEMFQKNEIYYDDVRVTEGRIFPGYDLTIPGTGNVLRLNKLLGNGKITIRITGNENHFSIGEDCTVMREVRILMTAANGRSPLGVHPQQVSIRIGNKVTFQGGVTFLSPLDAGRSITVGSYCLFAEGVFFRGRSEHLIYDMATKQRVNCEDDIYLGDGVWIGALVDFLPKARVPSHAVIAMRSLVNKSFTQEYVLLAGMPAQVKKENVMWHLNIDEIDPAPDRPL